MLEMSSSLGFMVSISNIGYWLGAIIVNQVASILSSSSLNISGTLFLFAVMTFVLFLFILLLLPETKVRIQCGLILCKPTVQR